MRHEHHGTFTEEQLPILAQIHKRSAPHVLEECPLCAWVPDSISEAPPLRQHLEEHLISLASVSFTWKPSADEKSLTASSGDAIRPLYKPEKEKHSVFDSEAARSALGHEVALTFEDEDSARMKLIYDAAAQSYDLDILTQRIDELSLAQDWDYVFEAIRPAKGFIDERDVVLEKLAADMEMDKVLHWLSPFDFVAQQKEIISDQTTEHVQWVLESAQFHQWLTDNRGSFLWVGGDDHMETTMLACAGYNHIKRFIEADQPLLCVFCRSFDDRVQTTGTLLGGMMRQLTAYSERLTEDMIALYDQHKDALVDCPETRQIFLYLERWLDQFSPGVYIVVEDLAVAPTEFLRHLERLLYDCNVKLLLTTRPEDRKALDFFPRARRLQHDMHDAVI